MCRSWSGVACVVSLGAAGVGGRCFAPPDLPSAVRGSSLATAHRPEILSASPVGRPKQSRLDP